jgi:signal transduction histidine kinase/CheY-like chemotaxis protein
VLLKSIENEKQLRIFYGVVLVVAAICTASITAFVLDNCINSIKKETLLSGKNDNENDAEQVNSFLIRSGSVLQVTARMVENLLERNASQAQIESLLVKELEYYKQSDDIALCNMFGIFRGEFFNGHRWTPAVGYVPSKRPWYQNAFMARGKLALVPTHANPRGGEQVISISQRLSDKKSVLALDLYLQNLVARMKRGHSTDVQLIIDKNGLVIAHTNISQHGRNYLSSEFWGKDEEKLAREIFIAGGEPFSFKYGRTNYCVYSSLVQGKWYVVRLVEEKILWMSLYKTVWVNIVAVLFFYIVFALLLNIGFRKYARSIRANRSKMAFLTSMSREIRTMVTGLLGLNTIVLKECRDENIKDYAKNIQNSGQSVLSLVNDVLDVSKIESGKLSIVSMEYDVFSVLQECYNEYDPKAKAKNLEFSVNCDPDIPSSLWGDENRIVQIINNLLSNAIKYTEVGEVSLSVGYDKLPPIGTLRSDDYIMLKITVRDTGMGIRPENLANIFNTYDSEYYTGSDQIEGVGLGLSLTQELLEKCGGHISVDSHYGEGTSFTAEIPQLVLNSEPMGDFALKYRNASRHNNKDLSEVFFAPEARVLIVDDIELNLKVFRGFLKNMQVKVDEAISAHQCLELVSVKRYDLIFLDHMMPVMDGMETYRQMKSKQDFPNKNTPVIVLASEGESLSKDSFLSEGFTDYLLKPIKERDLFRVLKWYLPKSLMLTSDDLHESLTDSAGMAKEMSREPVAGKTRYSQDEDEIVLHAVTAPTLHERFKMFEEFLDVKAGLDYCADDEDIYVEMLQEYVGSPLCRNVDACYKSGDWDNYRFYMHVLYDSSIAIGAISMAEKFLTLENACREVRMTVVREKHELAMALHAELIENIQKGLEER